MNLRRVAQIAVVAASVALAGAVHAADQVKKNAGARATGKVSKLDTAAKTFVVTNKKKGDTTVTFDDKTNFRKAAAGEGATTTEAKLADLKEGARVIVSGKIDAGKLVASSVVMGGHKKKAPK